MRARVAVRLVGGTVAIAQALDAKAAGTAIRRAKIRTAGAVAAARGHAVAPHGVARDVRTGAVAGRQAFDALTAPDVAVRLAGTAMAVLGTFDAASSRVAVLAEAAVGVPDALHANAGTAVRKRGRALPVTGACLTALGSRSAGASRFIRVCASRRARTEQ